MSDVILTLTVVHSCFKLYEKLPLQFIKFLQHLKAAVYWLCLH